MKNDLLNFSTECNEVCSLFIDLIINSQLFQNNCQPAYWIPVFKEANLFLYSHDSMKSFIMLPLYFVDDVHFRWFYCTLATSFTHFYFLSVYTDSVHSQHPYENQADYFVL